jgi:hypothetical protein
MGGSLLTFVCPACGVREAAANPDALARLREERLCQGCRARRSLERRPELLPLLVGFWQTSRFPTSSSWLHATLSVKEPGIASPQPQKTARAEAPH